MRFRTASVSVLILSRMILVQKLLLEVGDDLLAPIRDSFPKVISTTMLLSARETTVAKRSIKRYAAFWTASSEQIERTNSNLVILIFFIIPTRAAHLSMKKMTAAMDACSRPL